MAGGGVEEGGEGGRKGVEGGGKGDEVGGEGVEGGGEGDEGGGEEDEGGKVERKSRVCYKLRFQDCFGSRPVAVVVVCGADSRARILSALIAVACICTAWCTSWCAWCTW